MKNTKHAIIHVADIHYRKDAPEGASSIIKPLLKDLKERIDELSDYQIYIAITGDIVQAGEDMASYDGFISELDAQLKAIGLPKSARIVVPGNHDINRNLVKGKFDEYSNIHDRYTRTEESFNDFLSTPNILNDKFENFELFMSEFTEDSGLFSHLGWGWNIDDDVGVYCLNTALCSFGGLNDIEDEGQLAIYSRGLVDWCKKKTTATNILLLHHPINHLNLWSRNELQHLIETHFTLCLSGHNHLPEVYHGWVPSNSLVCTAPPLFCGKEDPLAYSIVLIEDGEPSSILYREYSNGQFLSGSRLAKNEDGVVKLGSTYLHDLKGLEGKLEYALQSYKGQPQVFIEPKLSESREFSDAPNLLNCIIESPENAIVVAPPQFGLTCLSLHMRVVAFKNRNFWIHIDGKQARAKHVLRLIGEDLQRYGKVATEIKCVMIDDWDATVPEHIKIAKIIINEYPGVPLILFSNKIEFLDPRLSLKSLDKTFRVLHLLALSRNDMRQLLSGYNRLDDEVKIDEALSQMTSHMESINIHRTALNCLTLLRVHGGGFNEKLLNKTKLMKAILFVLFTDTDSFLYSNTKPDVDECTFVLGMYCKELIKRHSRCFNAQEFMIELKRVCDEKLITLDVNGMIEVLVDNHILVKDGDMFEFKHTCWIYYFAAECMLHDADFKSYVLKEQRYANFPEIIDFYAGIDGKRTDAMEALLSDLNCLINRVDTNIGIKGPYNPLSTFLWTPSDKFLEETKKQIVEKVESSNLPPEIKDKHADEHYNSETPYDQSINNFFNEFSVLCLVKSIAASSRALRNSAFVDTKLKLEMTRTILSAWEEISKVIFWISPSLARNGSAVYDGFFLTLAEDFSTNLKERFRQIIIANPMNIVDKLGDDLSSSKIGKLLFVSLRDSPSDLQKHLVAIFLVRVRPVGWFDELLEHLNRLHPSSFYLAGLLGTLEHEIKLGFLDETAEGQLKQLAGAVLAKRKYASKALKNRTEPIPPNIMLSDENRLPIDQLLAMHSPSGPEEYGEELQRKKRR